MDELQETLRKAIEGINSIVTSPECTDVPKTDLVLMRELQGALNRVLEGVDPTLSSPECTDAPDRG